MADQHLGEAVGLGGEEVAWDDAGSSFEGDDTSLTPEGLEELLEGRLKSPEEACVHEFDPFASDDWTEAAEETGGA